jgi:arylsulfatase A-like enzyme
MRWGLFAAVVALAAGAIGWLVRETPLPRAPVIRLVSRLAEAQRVSQRAELIEPETLHLKPGVVKPPPGWLLAAPQPGEVAHLFCDEPRPLALRIDVPIDGGRDYVVRAVVRDTVGGTGMLVEHAPNPGQPELGWHKATAERSDHRVRLDWREDTPPGRTTLPVVITSPGDFDVVIESLTVREAGVRDPALVEAAPAAALHGLVDRPVDGVAASSTRGARRVLESLLASDGGVYEWRLAAPPPAELTFDTATVIHGVRGVPIEMQVELLTPRGWTRAFSTVRGGDGDAGSWRAARVPIPRDARALRLSTRATASGRPQVVAWGNPTLRDAPPPNPPHVLLLTLDAVRPDHLGAYGYARPTSKFLDGLASRGARFEDVTAQRGHTWASTTSLLTGRFPTTTGVIARGTRPARGLPGVADAFAAAGFTTVRIGSPDLPRGQLSGFDVTEIAEYDTDVTARLGELGRAFADRPLFIWAHVSTAHYPWRVGAEFVDHFDPGWRGPFHTSISRAEFRALLDAGPIPEPLRNHLLAVYDGAIAQMDHRLGQTLAQLDDAGFFANAIVAVTADHGAHFGEHDVWFMHSTPWHASLKVPLIVYAPGRVAPGTVVKASQGRALLLDVGPTLLELAGVPFDGLDGISLRGALAGEPLPPRTTVTRFDPGTYLRVEDDRRVLLWNPRGEPLDWQGEIHRTLPLPAVGLYNRAADPDEQHDLSAAEPATVEAMRALAERAGRGETIKLSTEARRLLQQAGYAGDDD